MTIRADYGDGQTIELTQENTMVFLFKGNSDLDHVLIKVDEHAKLATFDNGDVARVLVTKDFPVVMYPYRPEWAIERYMQARVSDFSQLLDQP